MWCAWAWGVHDHHSHPPHSPHIGCKRLPWRLTSKAIDIVDKRACNIVYPHGVNGISKDDINFLKVDTTILTHNAYTDSYIHTQTTKKSGRTWRSADKLTALLSVLPTILRGFVPAVREGFKKLIWGLRILQGRCINGTEAATLKVQPGSRPLVDDDVDIAHAKIIEGLSMLEGMLCV